MQELVFGVVRVQGRDDAGHEGNAVQNDCVLGDIGQVDCEHVAFL